MHQDPTQFAPFWTTMRWKCWSWFCAWSRFRAISSSLSHPSHSLETKQVTGVSVAPIARLAKRIGSQMQEIRGSNPSRGGLRVSPLQVSGGIKHSAVKGLRPPEHHTGHSIWTKMTPPSQKQNHAKLVVSLRNEHSKGQDFQANCKPSQMQRSNRSPF